MQVSASQLKFGVNASRVITVVLTALALTFSISPSFSSGEPLPTPEYRRIVIYLNLSTPPYSRACTPTSTPDLQDNWNYGHCIGPFLPGTYPFGSGPGRLDWWVVQDDPIYGQQWGVSIGAMFAPDGHAQATIGGSHVGGVDSGWFWVRGLNAPWGFLAPGGDRDIRDAPPGSPGGPLMWGVSPATDGYIGGVLILSGYVYVYPTGIRSLPESGSSNSAER